MPGRPTLAIAIHAWRKKLLCHADESARRRTIKVNLFRRTYNALRPHQALDERTRAAYLGVEHCD
jgi:hypothetical protein